MGNPLTPTPPPGTDVGGMVSGALGPDVGLTNWHAQQQQRYNQVTGFANLLNWASTSGILDKDAASIAGGQYLRFLGEKDPYKALPKYTQWLQETLEAHKIGQDAQQKAQNPPQPGQGGPPVGSGSIQPPPGSSMPSVTARAMQAPPGNVGAGPAALPATPNGQIGANPQSGVTALPMYVQRGQQPQPTPSTQSQPGVSDLVNQPGINDLVNRGPFPNPGPTPIPNANPNEPPQYISLGQTPKPPPGGTSMGFGVGWQDVLARNQAMLNAQAQAPEQARIAGEQQQFDQVLKNITGGKPKTATPEQLMQAQMLSTPRYLGGIPGASFTAAANMAAHGMHADGTPMTPDELSAQAKAQIDLKESQADLAKYSEQLKAAQAAVLTDPNNPKLHADIQRMLMLTQMAGQRLQIAQANLGIRSVEFGANYAPGTLSPQMQQDMGLPTDESGQAVGLKSPEAPTTAQRGRRDQAIVIQNAGQNLISAINANRDKFGNLQAVLNNAFLGTPVADPASQGLAAQIRSFAALQPALHGFRGQQALNEFLKGIGGLPNNPDALIAGIKQGYMGTAGAVKSAVRTTRSSMQPPPGANQQSFIYARDPQGKLHRAPAGTTLPQGWKAESAPAGQ